VTTYAQNIRTGVLHLRIAHQLMEGVRIGCDTLGGPFNEVACWPDGFLANALHLMAGLDQRRVVAVIRAPGAA
jgi:hypothetical protein